MADTTFVNYQTPINAEWLNDVNRLTYDLPSTASGKGASLVGVPADTPGTQPATLFSIIKERTSFSRYLSAAKQADVLSGALTLDCSTELATALAERAGKKLTLPGLVRVSSSFSVEAGTIFEGESRNYSGLVQYGSNMPILKPHTEGIRVANMLLKYSSPATSAHTNSVAIRGRNCYESQFDQLYIYNSFGGFDQEQALIDGGQNAWFSNNVTDVRIVVYSGWAIRMIPFSGGNSGNVWSNIYINNRNGALPSNSLACLGGVWFQTSDDGTVDQLNIEWSKPSGSLLVLNQAGNMRFRGLHIEGNYPTSAFQPLIDVLGGAGSSPRIDGLTLAGNDWTGAASQALIRLDANGTRMELNGVSSRSNTTPANMSLITSGGSTSYGSSIEIGEVIDADGSLMTDAYTPKVFFGTPTAGVEYPLQRLGRYQARHAAMITDNAGGTFSTTAAKLPGSVLTVGSEDPMGLWDSTNTRFQAKQSGLYKAFVSIPTATTAVIQVKKNGAVVSTFSVGTGGTGSAMISLSRGDIVEFFLASGSYTRTAVTCGVSLDG